MDHDATLTLVRTLTRPVLELFAPAQVDDFEDDFAAWSLSAGTLGVGEKISAMTPPRRGLDTTLVSGMFFQVVMEASLLPAGPQERVSFIRKRAKDYLVTQLAGQITLSQFYRLLTLIEEEAGLYFTRQDWSGGKSGLRETREAGCPRRRGCRSRSSTKPCARRWPKSACPPKAGASSPPRPWGNISGKPKAAGFACWTSKPGLT